MNRKALIIINPGEQDSENYCQGVRLDARNYKAFLLAPFGGSWLESEIETLDRPSVSAAKSAIERLRESDYGLIVFSGHGYSKDISDSTILELSREEELDSAELKKGCPKMTLVLDCCRVVSPRHAEKAAILENVSVTAGLDSGQCRALFDEKVAACPESLVVLHSCSRNQTAGDDSLKGGYYSYNLIDRAMAWKEELRRKNSLSAQALSVVAAHERAIPGVQSMSGGRQVPQVEKPRSGPYFPFCVYA